MKIMFTAIALAIAVPAAAQTTPASPPAHSEHEQHRQHSDQQGCHCPCCEARPGQERASCCDEPAGHGAQHAEPQGE